MLVFITLNFILFIILQKYYQYRTNRNRINISLLSNHVKIIIIIKFINLYYKISNNKI